MYLGYYIVPDGTAFACNGEDRRVELYVRLLGCLGFFPAYRRDPFTNSAIRGMLVRSGFWEPHPLEKN